MQTYVGLVANYTKLVYIWVVVNVYQFGIHLKYIYSDVEPTRCNNSVLKVVGWLVWFGFNSLTIYGYTSWILELYRVVYKPQTIPIWYSFQRLNLQIVKWFELVGIARI